MLTRSACLFCACFTLALVVVGCQRSGDVKVSDNAPAVNEEQPTTVDAREAVASAAAGPTPSPAAHDEAPSAPIEVAADAIQPHMSIASDGGIYLTFIHRGNISVSISHDRGQTFSDPVVAIDVQGRARGGMHRGPRIGVDGEGNITVTAPVTFDAAEYEKKYPTADLFLVRSTDGGKTWSQPTQINEVAKKAPEALHWMTIAPSGVAHVAWLDMRDREKSGQDLYYTTVVAGEVGANEKIATTVCECCAPGMTVDAAGNPLVAYREGGTNPSREIFARWSTDGGRSFGDAMQINKQKTLEDG
ncbi:MAG TPA: sialidase family protein [Pirellulaceae bacterium]|nr:sialidase family protein [Pirellulaceae bacterium]